MNTKQQRKIIYTPYCYLIGWSKYKKYYYGVRYSTKLNCIYKSGCHPDDLWKTYFTSSSYVKECRSTYGEPDIIQVRRTFYCAKKALIWEQKVLKKLGVLKDSKWLNKNIGGSIYWDEDLKNKVRGRRGSRSGRTMQEMRPGWINPLKGKTAKERYKKGWVCYRKGKTLKDIWGKDYIDPRSKPFTIVSNLLGEMKFNNVRECSLKTGLDGICILNLKSGKIRKIRRRKTTKHVFPDNDIIKINLS